MDMRVGDLFKIGIGPSSSHTVGPMLAARRFLVECGNLEQVAGVQVALYGSLALTGVGHATDKAVLLGLMGETPQDIAPETVAGKLEALQNSGRMQLLGKYDVAFDLGRDLLWHKQETLPGHPNGMRFTLQRTDGSVSERVFYSIGGGFIHAEDEMQAADRPHQESASAPVA